MAIGLILSVWAINGHAHGVLNLSDFDYRYIYNFGPNCYKRLTFYEQELATQVLDDLIEKNIILKQVA